jgi:hypothetical protein
MKRILMIVIIAAISGFIAVAQNPFRELSVNYRYQKQYFASELGKKSIKLYLKEKAPSPDVKEVLDKIDNLRVLNFSMAGVELIPTFINDVYSSYKLVNYIPFKVNRSSVENQLVFLKENDSGFSDLLLINTSMARVSLIEIQGVIDLEKMALLKNVLNIEGLDDISNMKDVKKTTPKTFKKTEKNVIPAYGISPYKNSTPGSSGIAENYNSIIRDSGRTSINNNGQTNEKSVKIMSKSGSQLIGTSDNPLLFINGFASASDYQTALQSLNPKCIQSISVTTDPEGAKKMGHSNGMIEVRLNGNSNELFFVCEGILYFGQNGIIQTVSIDDECGPNLLVDCRQKPLSEIVNLKPQQIKSIELTTDPRNCKCQLDGKYIVMETK